MTEPEVPPSPFYPVSLDVAGVPCLVVGGGPVAARKARGLVACGAHVTVIAPSLGSEMEEVAPLLAAVHRRAYELGDAASFRLVLTATGLESVDADVYADADAHGVWANSADDRAHCSFILPAVHRDGAVTVAVSTGGLSPALAVWLRNRLSEQCGDGIGLLAELLHEVRERLLRSGLPSDTVEWTELLDGPLPSLVAAGELDQARTILAVATSDAGEGSSASP